LQGFLDLLIVNTVGLSAILISCSFTAQGHARPIYLRQSTISQQIAPPVQEKLSRTAAQKKIDSHLLDAIRCSRAKPNCGVRLTQDELVKTDSKGRVRVDIRAKVTPKTLAVVRKLGGRVIAVFKQYQSIEALLPLNRLETLARSNEVKFIGIPAAPMTSELPLKPNKQ
jgi:hypothetical protein